MTNNGKNYLHGLIQAKAKNIERMIEVVPQSQYDSQHHFLSEVAWDHRLVLDQVAQKTHLLLPNDHDRGLIIDESAHVKKGNHSVGVQRQWCGRLGKKDNCQVGVYAALVHGQQTTLIDSRLYLPKVWINDRKRCQEARIPQEEITYRSISEIALQSVRHQRVQGIDFNWVGLDGGYGKEPRLLRELEKDGETFMADVHKDQRVYLSDPQPSIPPQTPGRGRAPSKLKAHSKPIRVDQWAQRQAEEAWKKVRVRQTTKGFLDVEILHQRVWLWDGKEEKAKRWHLVIRREIGNSQEIKYSISNAKKNIKIQRLAYMQAQRYWVEASLKNGKSEAGMSDYQVRGWLGWNHHMALVLMAMLFMLETRQQHQQHYPLLSCADVARVLLYCLPRRDITFEEVIRQLEFRHQQRLSSIRSAYRKQRLKTYSTGNMLSYLISDD